jgi:chromosomal replication initiator protein
MADQLSLLDGADATALKAAWEEVLAEFKGEYPETVLERFLRPLCPVALSESFAVFNAPGQFVADWVREKYQNRIEEAISAKVGRAIRLEIRGQLRERPTETGTVESVNVAQPIVADGLRTFVPDPRYRFENFIVGDTNRLAFAGANAVAASPGTKYNPLFIYGMSGLGKTHLMHAVSHAVLAHNPRAVVMYMTAQQFAEEFVHALQNQKIDTFRRMHRGVHLWLLDDVQFVAGKERTQEEVFHTFNYLYGLKKQIVVCSDRPPRDLLLMDERLRSRFESSLVADVTMPGTELRCAILLAKAAEEKLEVGHDVAMFLAESIPSNVRILEGALTKLAAQASFLGRPINLQLAEEIVERYYAQVGAPKPSCDQILDTVSKHYRIRVEDIKGQSRKAPIAHARHVAVYMAREITGDSWKHIGEMFGNRDHTSAMHGYKKIRELMDRDKELNSTVRMLIRDVWPGV